MIIKTKDQVGQKTLLMVDLVILKDKEVVILMEEDQEVCKAV